MNLISNNYLRSLPKTLMTIKVALVMTCPPLEAQKPQDNWYLEKAFVKAMDAASGGLSSPCASAVSPDQRVFIADRGLNRISIYKMDGTYLSSIGPNFGGPQSFGSLGGMVFDKAGKLYVADDSDRNCVWVFNPDGTFNKKVGGVTGSAQGQLDAATDVGVSTTGKIYILDHVNCRVSIFDDSGVFLKSFGQPGSLDSQFVKYWDYRGVHVPGPTSIAVAPNGKVYVTDPSQGVSTEANYGLKEFDPDGNFLRKWSFSKIYGISGGAIAYNPISIRFDPSGVLHVIRGWYLEWGSAPNPQTNHYVMIDMFDPDYGTLFSTTMSNGSDHYNNRIIYTYHGVGPEGSLVLIGPPTKSYMIYRRALREQFVPPQNSIPMPSLISTIQRPNSPYIDIDYEVDDADDTTVQTAMLAFKSGAQLLANCINNLTLVEGTEAKLGTGIATNQKHRVTWNSGADWTTPLADYKVAILAKDSRQGLLDVHYLDLPAAGGIGPLRISRSPLIETDYMQVWWWLLATHDTGIRLDPTGKIYGVGGSYEGLLLCDGSVTPSTKPEGRNYIFAKLGVREATTAEVAWAKSGSSAGTGTSTVNQWSPGRQVGGRPKYVNEYGFDTGDWSAASYNARWVIATP